jgi:hypothetical protein
MPMSKGIEKAVGGQLIKLMTLNAREAMTHGRIPGHSSY